MSLTYPVYLRTLDEYIRVAHGSARPLTAEEMLVMDEYAAAVIEDVQDAWPVDTSTSRDAWTYTLRDAPGEMGFVLENDTYYVQYVHESGMPADAPLWEYLLPQVVQSYAGLLLSAMRSAADATEQESTRNRATGGRGFLDIIAARFRIPVSAVARG
jgi:hypothetical protein